MAEIFQPGMFNLGTPLDHLLISVPPLRSWDDDAVLGELRRMEAEGLVVKKSDSFFSTYEGQVAKERLLQREGYRAACLHDQLEHDMQDLTLAVIVAGQLPGGSGQSENDETLAVYLHRRSGDLKAAADALVEHGYVRLVEISGPRGGRTYYPTGRGMRHYDVAVRERLRIPKHSSILDAVEVAHGPTAEASAFKALVFHEHLGDGAYGDVWKAHDPLLQREVAVKVFFSSETETVGALAHARALARVRHNNVVAVHEVVTTTSPTDPSEVVEAIVMELIDGETLANRLTRGRLFLPDHARRVGHAILDGVAAIHAAGLGHCDLHEGNVLLDAAAGAKVIDILHRGLFADMSTRSRVDYVARDIAAVRELLGLVIRHTDVDVGAGFGFRESTKSVHNLEDLRAAYDVALPASL
jgi:tRNA A-37 threonylcarbamoyl transferase component Bud32